MRGHFGEEMGYGVVGGGGVASAAAVDEDVVGGVEAVAGFQVLGFGGECGLHVVYALGEAVEEKRGVGSDVVADLHDEFGVIGVSQTLKEGDPCVGGVAVFCGEKLGWVIGNGGGFDIDTGSLEFFDKDGAGIVGGLDDADGSHERPLVGHRWGVVDGERAADGCGAGGFADAGGKLGVELDFFGAVGGGGVEGVVDAKGGGVRAVLYGGELAGAGGVDGEVDYIVVDEDGPEVELVAEVPGLEETVVDDDVAGDLLDAGGGDLPGEGGVSGEGVGRSGVGVAESVGFVVVEVADGDGAVGVGAAAHGEVA